MHIHFHVQNHNGITLVIFEKLSPNKDGLILRLKYIAFAWNMKLFVVHSILLFYVQGLQTPLTDVISLMMEWRCAYSWLNTPLPQALFQSLLQHILISFCKFSWCNTPNLNCLLLFHLHVYIYQNSFYSIVYAAPLTCSEIVTGNTTIIQDAIFPWMCNCWSVMFSNKNIIEVLVDLRRQTWIIIHPHSRKLVCTKHEMVCFSNWWHIKFSIIAKTY